MLLGDPRLFARFEHVFPLPRPCGAHSRVGRLNAKPARRRISGRSALPFRIVQLLCSETEWTARRLAHVSLEQLWNRTSLPGRGMGFLHPIELFHARLPALCCAPDVSAICQQSGMRFVVGFDAVIDGMSWLKPPVRLYRGLTVVSAGVRTRTAG